MNKDKYIKKITKNLYQIFNITENQNEDGNIFEILKIELLNCFIKDICNNLDEKIIEQIISVLKVIIKVFNNFIESTKQKKNFDLDMNVFEIMLFLNQFKNIYFVFLKTYGQDKETCGEK